MGDPALPIAVDFISEREGFRSFPYRDNGRGVATIGYGFTYLPNGHAVTMTTPPMAQPAAKAILTEMVVAVLGCVRTLVAIEISDHAAAALTSFCFNEGTNALKTSTMLKLINAGKMVQASEQFAAWCYAGGHIDAGLKDRRELERQLFMTPDDTINETPDSLNVSVEPSTIIDPPAIHPAPRVEDEADLLDSEFNPGVPV